MSKRTTDRIAYVLFWITFGISLGEFLDSEWIEGVALLGFCGMGVFVDYVMNVRRGRPWLWQRVRASAPVPPPEPSKQPPE